VSGRNRVGPEPDTPTRIATPSDELPPPLPCSIPALCAIDVLFSPLSLEFCRLRVFNFGPESPDLWVLDVIVILAFGLRRKSFGVRVFLLSGLMNKSYPCIWFSLSSTDLVLNLKFSHGLADWS
jgi:hypothetical protein